MLGEKRLLFSSDAVKTYKGLRAYTRAPLQGDEDADASQLLRIFGAPIIASLHLSRVLTNLEFSTWTATKLKSREAPK